MLTFIVPVKSKKVSRSWTHFSKLFERTLKSISNQTSDKFRIVVVCHEKPDSNFQHPNLEFIHVDFEPPVLDSENSDQHNDLKEEDKSGKILAGLEYIKKYEQDYVMVADADDCVSNKIAAFVETHIFDNVPGWYFKRGYVYREGDRFISLNKENFSTLCGTGIIVKPELMQHVFKKTSILYYAHDTIELTENDALRPFPLPGSVYSMANGDNHYMSGNMINSKLTTNRHISGSWVKGIFRKLQKYRIQTLNSSIKKEFGIYDVSKKGLD